MARRSDASLTRKGVSDLPTVDQVREKALRGLAKIAGPPPLRPLLPALGEREIEINNWRHLAPAGDHFKFRCLELGDIADALIKRRSVEDARRARATIEGFLLRALRWMLRRLPAEENKVLARGCDDAKAVLPKLKAALREVTRIHRELSQTSWYEHQHVVNPGAATEDTYQALLLAIDWDPLFQVLAQVRQGLNPPGNPKNRRDAKLSLGLRGQGLHNQEIKAVLSALLYR